MKYSVDCFTPNSVGTKFPENSYDADTVEEVAKIVKDCTREIAGIRKVEVWINEVNAPTMGRVVINARPYTLPFGEVSYKTILDLAGFTEARVSVRVPEKLDLIQYLFPNEKFIFEPNTMPVINVTNTTPGIPFPTGHHVCDECGKLGPTMGQNERICFWLCDDCMKEFATST